MDQGQIRTFMYYEWLLGNDKGTTEKPAATTRERTTTFGCSKSIIYNRLNLLGYLNVLVLLDSSPPVVSTNVPANQPVVLT
ncbi:unnamed protein product [Caenorhabditis auriculariae]|uniref:Uncharacterized protein n=1 Tax=Caenorhabditis auriculariae TaxID=2777116 RepID=A0A8S1HSB9_9PELO|nr:unnamed protein product [Caenorhabditis auriculariae]